MSYDWILTDFSTVLPAEKASRAARPGIWQLADYRTDELTGTLIMANPDVAAPEIAITLPLQGRYEIYLGFFENFGDRLKLKLPSDRCYERLAPSQPFGTGPNFQDVYWRTLDLTGNEQILIKQDGAFRAAVGYIMAKKVADEPLQRHGRCLLHVTDDGFPSNWGKPDDHEDESWLVEPLMHLGCNYISLGIDICGLANYPTRHDSLRIPLQEILDNDVFAWEHAKLAVELMLECEADGYQVPKRYYELVQQQGAQALGYSRMAHIHASPPYDAMYSTLYDAHQEYRCIDISGVAVNRLSYAFPEVRQEFAKLFTEQVEMGANGVNMVFVRGLPAVLYEEPVRARFQELYGEDCMQLPENDPRAQKVRMEFVTTFMREQRKALDAAGSGRKINILVSVPATREICEFYGLDIPTWIAEGLIDILCPYKFGIDAGAADLEMDFFCQMVQGTSVLLLPYINTWRDTAESCLQTAIDLMKYPIGGFSVWDAVSCIDRSRQTVFLSLGDAEAMQAALEKIRAGATHRYLITQDDTLVNKYHFGWNF